MSAIRRTTYGTAMAANKPPYGAATGGNYKTAVSLAADEVLANLPYVSLVYGGRIDVFAIVHGATKDDAPANTPIGVFELYASADGVDYHLVTAAASTLAALAPNGNTRIASVVSFTNTPGMRVKVRYKRTSGGASGAFVTMNLVTDGDEDEQFPA